jgi:hypothetical protein
VRLLLRVQRRGVTSFHAFSFLVLCLLCTPTAGLFFCLTFLQRAEKSVFRGCFFASRSPQCFFNDKYLLLLRAAAQASTSPTS